jgi:hypothetical protein
MRLAAFLVAMTFAVQTPEQRLGSFTIAGQTYTVIVRNQTQLEIRDQSSAVQYQKTIQPGVSATAKLSSGNGLAGLLLHYVRDGGESWQLFRLKDGKLAPLDAPVANGPIIANGVITGAVARGAAGAITRLNPADTIELRVWGGSFYLIVPLRVDWQQGRTAPGQQCFAMAGAPGLTETGCEMRVEATRKPGTSDFTFVRLFNEATETMGAARHVVIKKDAKIEYLAAKAMVKWNTVADEFSADLNDIWLKVLIDDNENNLGWIHTDDDFSAVGLPRGNAAP